jgi:hypothetical protein
MAEGPGRHGPTVVAPPQVKVAIGPVPACRKLISLRTVGGFAAMPFVSAGKFT